MQWAFKGNSNLITATSVENGCAERRDSRCTEVWERNQEGPNALL